MLLKGPLCQNYGHYCVRTMVDFLERKGGKNVEQVELEEKLLLIMRESFKHGPCDFFIKSWPFPSLYIFHILEVEGTSPYPVNNSLVDSTTPNLSPCEMLLSPCSPSSPCSGKVSG